MSTLERLRRRLATVLFVGAGGLLIVLLGLGGAAGSAGLGADRHAPDFELPLLSGGQLSHEELVGRVTVLNVWASWCPPCREEAPVLRRVEDSVDPREVAFLGIVRNDSADAARRFVEDFGLTYPNVIDDGSFARAYGVRGLPMTFVVAADGALVMTHFGPISESKLRAVVDDALRRTAPDAGTGD